MLIQVCSDIHLEYDDDIIRDFPAIVTNIGGQILILTGDIGDPFSDIYKDFINYCSRIFEYVIVIAGNHEYYHHNIDETDAMIYSITDDYANVIFLQNTTFIYDDYVFVGTTLWSHIPDDIENHELYLIRDYHHIKGYSTYMSNNLHETAVKFITETLETHKEKKIIVLSHHAPSIKCLDPKFYTDPLNCCYMSRLDYLFRGNLKAWINGHTHFNFESNENGVLLYANCYRGNNYSKKCVTI